jgi:nucleotide-binding universal stress UspA family protein
VKILLALDMSKGSEEALRAVLTEFTPARHDVRVFHAVDWAEHLPASFLYARGPEAAESVIGFRDRLLREVDGYVRAAAERLRAAGFTVSTEVSPEGDPPRAILKEAAAWPADLIVVGSHGRSGLERVLLGSVSDRVVRHAPCSVHVVRSRKE